jgi:carboxymethylenebutenolidase
MDDERESEKRDDVVSDLSRRNFIAMSVAAGIVAASGSASAAALPIIETNVVITTPDGMCDAAFIHPAGGSHPGVLIWPDHRQNRQPTPARAEDQGAHVFRYRIE